VLAAGIERRSIVVSRAKFIVIAPFAVLVLSVVAAGPVSADG
jgi:hypothetical protein